MTHSPGFLLQRAFEHASAAAAALGLTALMVLTNSAANPASSGVTPTVTIQMPTVEIEELTSDAGDRVATAHYSRVNG